ncbi:MAG: penicillin-binding protein 1B [Bdellovibrio sp. CG10_big_fil_rev_8_21_14_0_10_47_8]|nr:MAG: penicillin-binding protein 1B [Bdellovibrio sp. CG10_big_fil_rev_8_21_14_0_10_47_8]
MKKLKPYLILLAALSCLVILFAGIWTYQLNSRIQEGLEQKKFLPPTEYYAAPVEFSAKLVTTSKSELVSVLKLRGYRSRDWNQRLFPGDFAEASREVCQNSVPPILPEGVTSCLLLAVKETADPELSKLALQMAAFDSQDQLAAAFSGNPLQEATKIALEPELFAQYLDQQPIMQNYTPLGEIPTQCLNAVLAIEDSQFLEHSGFSFPGIARALLSNVTGGKVKQGGSTITQQMVKNYFLTSERTLKRKATELVMSVLLETHSSKDQILETYLNIIYLGQNGPFQIRGFGAAAQYYFNKPLEQLELPECAMLAAVLNSPGLYDPFLKTENAIKRRSLVLDRMQTLKMISSEDAEKAKSATLPTRQSYSVNETAPYYINAANKEIIKMGLDPLGLKVFTGLSLVEQQAAQQAIRGHLDQLEAHNKKVKKIKESGKTLEGLLVSAHNQSGLISAIVGGRSYRLTQFNRATDGHRQVGSIMKPFVYLTALIDSGKNGKVYDPLTPLNDIPFSYRFDGQKWSPENYGRKYFGQVPMYFALKNSLNSATAQLGLEVGIPRVIETAKSLGIESPLSPVPSVTLGAFELYPLEVLKAYVALARMGNSIPISTLRAITNEKGLTLYESHPEGQQVVSEVATAELISMMKQTVRSGTAQGVSLSGFTTPAAGKTGTTSDYKDAWFSGITPEQSTLVWIGYDDPTSNSLTGASGAVPAWISFMKKAPLSQVQNDFSWPESVELRPMEVDEENKVLHFELAFPK